MRKLAMTMLFIVGCAAAPTSEQDDAPPPPIVPALESVTGEVVLGPDDVGGGGPSGGVTPATEVESGGSGGEYAADTGGTCEEGGDETCEASLFGSFGGWFGACLTGAGIACDLVITVCVQGRAATVGPLAVPCGAAIIGACAGTLACVAKTLVSP